MSSFPKSSMRNIFFKNESISHSSNSERGTTNMDVYRDALVQHQQVGYGLPMAPLFSLVTDTSDSHPCADTLQLTQRQEKTEQTAVAPSPPIFTSCLQGQLEDTKQHLNWTLGSPTPLQNENNIKMEHLEDFRSIRLYDMQNRHRGLELDDETFGKVYKRHSRHIHESSENKKRLSMILAKYDEDLYNAKQAGHHKLSEHLHECLLQTQAQMEYLRVQERGHQQRRLKMIKEQESPFFPELPIVLGRFVFDSFLGAGGSASVWRVYDSKTNGFVALKIGKPKWISDEFRVHRTLHHKHIVPLIDQSDTEALHFTYNNVQYGGFAMPVETTDLDVSMRDYHVSECLEIMFQLYCALVYLHNDMGTAHCDIKPANILISENGYVRVTDLQLAKPANDRVRTSDEGTLGFLAPECFNQDRHDASHSIPTYAQVDMWAAGIVCYHLLFHEHPIIPPTTSDRRSIKQAIFQFNGQLLFPEEDPSRSIPPWIKHFLSCSLHPDGRNRPTANEAFHLFRKNAMM